MVDVVFFFKQKTAYEMRISDWSSDVCSSDLQVLGRTAVGSLGGAAAERAGLPEWAQDVAQLGTEVGLGFLPKSAVRGIPGAQSLVGEIPTLGRSEERRVGKECVSTFRSRCPPCH